MITGFDLTLNSTLNNTINSTGNIHLLSKQPVAGEDETQSEGRGYVSDAFSGVPSESARR